MCWGCRSRISSEPGGGAANFLGPAAKAPQSGSRFGRMNLDIDIHNNLPCRRGATLICLFRFSLIAGSVLGFAVLVPVA